MYCLVIVTLLWVVTIPDYSRLEEYKRHLTAIKDDSNEAQIKNSVVLLKAGLCGCWMAITKHVSEMYKSAKEQFKYTMDNKKSY
jgi:putative component of toxin-antitoxin plasmid stabilization module